MVKQQNSDISTFLVKHMDEKAYHKHKVKGQINVTIKTTCVALMYTRRL